MAVHAPTLGSEEETKDSFYDDIQDAVDRVPVGDMLIVAGTGTQDLVLWT